MPRFELRRVGSVPCFLIAVVCGLGLTLATGCGSHDPTGPGLVPLTLKAQGQGGPTLTAARSATTLDRSATATAPTSEDPVEVTLTEAYLVVRDVRFKPPDSMDEIRFTGPYVIDLLSGLAQELDTKMVPPGAYERVQGHLQALRSEDGASEGKSFLVGSTVYMAGTISGDSGGDFALGTRIDTEFMIRGAFTVDADTPATSFVTFDLDGWLRDRDGRFLDPRDPGNLQAIEKSVRHSVKVGMDEDGDDEPDNEEMTGSND